MANHREGNIKIVAARLRRRIDAGGTTQEVFWDDLKMLLDLIAEDDK